MTRQRYKKAEPLAPKIVTAQFMLYVNALIWLGFGIYVFFDMLRANNNAQTMSLISFFLLVNVAVMAICGVTIGRRDPWAYYFSLFIVGLNAIFTRFGQFELFDLLAFFVDLVIFIFLLSMARMYLQKS